MAFKLFTNKRHHCVHVAPGIIWLYLAGPIHPHLYSFTHHFPSGPLSFFFPPSHLLVPTRSLPLSFCAPSAHHIPLSFCSVSYPPPKLGPIEIIQASNPNSHFCHRISANKQLLPVSVHNYCIWCVILHGVWFCSIYMVKTKPCWVKVCPTPLHKTWQFWLTRNIQPGVLEKSNNWGLWNNSEL